MKLCESIKTLESDIATTLSLTGLCRNIDILISDVLLGSDSERYIVAMHFLNPFDPQPIS